MCIQSTDAEAVLENESASAALSFVLILFSFNRRRPKSRLLINSRHIAVSSVFIIETCHS